LGRTGSEAAAKPESKKAARGGGLLLLSDLSREQPEVRP